MDDDGNFYASHSDLISLQNENRTAWYAANEAFWATGGYGGSTDEEAMVGDKSGEQDGEEGLAFLDRVLLRCSGGDNHTEHSNYSSGVVDDAVAVRKRTAVDVGAGVGRVTKAVLLKRCGSVHLLEGNSHLSHQSKTYLGRKRSDRCTFTCIKLEMLHADDIFSKWKDEPADIVWCQWTLQYLTDDDVVIALRALARGLVSETGYLIVKENRPFGHARDDRFQLETPDVSGRYDICRTDGQHRLLFGLAGLVVVLCEEGEETNTYALVSKRPE